MASKILAEEGRVEEMWWKQANDLIPGGTLTTSKHPSRLMSNYPKFIKSGEKCFLEDLDGKVYTDYISGLGAIILGYADRFVNRRVVEQISLGNLYSMGYTRTISLAKSLTYHIPSAEMVKLFKNGTDATSAAVRVARAYTGKEKILVCGYHGWADWYAVCQKGKAGIPRSLEALVGKFQYNDIESLRKHFTSDDIAAVIMEPVQFEEPKNDFLKQVKQVCQEHGALLIFDEIITGYRMGLSGAQGLLGVVPDLTTVSKAMGNGYPISALVGRKEYMEVWLRDDFFVSGTFNGDLVGVAAALEVTHQLETNDKAKLKAIWKSGQTFKDGANLITQNLKVDVRCEGYAPRTGL